MGHTPVIEAGRVQSWRRKGIKQHLKNLLFDQLSNRFTFNQTVPGAGERALPTTVVHKVSDSFREGEHKTTMISVRKPRARVIAGPNSASGKEYKGTTKAVSIFYNVQRFPMAVRSKSVSGRMTNFHKIAEGTSDTIHTLMAEQSEVDYDVAMLTGAEQGLWDPAAWEDSEYGSDMNHPLEKVFHPNVYAWINGAAVKNTWDPTYATALSNLETLTDTEMDNGDGMSLAAVDKMHLIATRTLAPIGGMNGVNEIKWVVIMSDTAWFQLSQDNATNGARDLFKYTEKGFERVINGWHGVYRNMAFFVRQRSPLLDNTSGTLSIQYMGPWGDDRVPQEKASSDGTMEVTYVCGAGAWGLADIEDLDYEKEGKDYNFNQNMCGIRTKGIMRIDLDDTPQVATANRINETSFVFLTATTAAAITT
jgi:hypothetical protein